VIPGVRVTVVSYAADVSSAAHEAAVKSLRSLSTMIEYFARASMHAAKGPSPPGTPPHVHLGRLRRSIASDVDEAELSAIVGPSYSTMKSGGLPAWIGIAHELGGTFEGKHYPARPFMGPALSKFNDTFAGDFSGSLSD
jgi:hypothetical protein